MNYWLITTEFPPIHGGGISTYCWHTAQMLAEANYSVTVFVNDYSVHDEKREFPLENVELIRFNPSKVKKGEVLGPEARLSIEFAHKVEQEIKAKGAPDILETQDYLGIGYYIMQQKHLLYPLFKNLNVLVTMHAPSFLYLDYNQVPYYNFPDYWIGEMEKASIRMADLVISPSNYLIDALNPLMHLAEKNPIRIFNPYKNEWTNNEIPEVDRGDLVFFGKLTPQKGCLELLVHLKKMWDEGFKKPLSIIGGGAHFFYPVQEDMVVHVKKLYAKEIKQGLIRFEGNMPPSKLKERLKKAHIIITPSIVDNLPYAVLEAMAMGKVVLSSSNGGHTEVLKQGESGFIFEHDIEGSFKDQLKAILALSNEEIKTVGKNAQLAVERSTNYKVVLQHKMEALKNLLKSNTLSSTFPFIEPIEKNKAIKQDQSIAAGKLSVVIPYYNMGNYIDETLDSLGKVSYKDLEIIVINDGSTDQKSIGKLESIKQKNTVKVVHKSNGGLSETRNYGAELATGEFLAFLDADDTVSPEYYEKAVAVLKQYENVSFVGCWAQYFGESTDRWPTFNPEPPYFLLHNVINSSALVYKKNDFLSFGKNDPKLIYGMEDYDSVIAMVKNGARGVAFPELWWQYRIRKNSMAQSFTTNKELYLYRLISKKHKTFYTRYGAELVNLLNHNGPGINFDNPTWPSNQLNASKFLNAKLLGIIKKNKILRRFAKKAYQIVAKR